MDSKNRCENRNTIVSCQICFKQMRSDNLNRHTEKQHSESKVSLDDELQQVQEKYHDKVEMGYHIYNSIVSKKISQTALTGKYDEALHLYKNHRPTIDVENAELRPWQKDALKLLEDPADRDVIWIRGCKGNEGKSWFQAYVQSLYGFVNVACLDMKCKASDSLLLLSKLPLVNMDKFLFNDVRATSVETEPCYNLLEMIKDGRGVSSKYNTNIVQFRTPNVVIVFSNAYPNVKQLSEDRWDVYNITVKGLHPVDTKDCKLYF